MPRNFCSIRSSNLPILFQSLSKRYRLNQRQNAQREHNPKRNSRLPLLKRQRNRATVDLRFRCNSETKRSISGTSIFVDQICQTHFKMDRKLRTPASPLHLSSPFEDPPVRNPRADDFSITLIPTELILRKNHRIHSKSQSELRSSNCSESI